MNLNNLINIPLTTPIVRNPTNRLEVFLKGYFSTENKVYVVRHIQARTIQVELKTVNYHLKGFWRLLFVISIIGPAICILAVFWNFQERRGYNFTLIQHPIDRILEPIRPVVEQEHQLMPIVRDSIQRSLKSQIPLSPKFYITNIVKALSIYLEADPTASNYTKVKELVRLKDKILEEIIRALQVPLSRQENMYATLESVFEKEFSLLLKNPVLQLKICLGIIRSIPNGSQWFARMEKAFCELISTLPDDLDALKKEPDYKALQDAVELLALHNEGQILDLPQLTRFRDIYNPVVVKLGLPEMDLKNFTENDDSLARALQFPLPRSQIQV